MKFDGHTLIERLMQGFDHDPHPALPDDAYDPVFACDDIAGLDKDLRDNGGFLHGSLRGRQDFSKMTTLQESCRDEHRIANIAERYIRAV
jgi:hypothetical protein